MFPCYDCCSPFWKRNGKGARKSSKKVKKKIIDMTVYFSKISFFFANFIELMARSWKSEKYTLKMSKWRKSVVNMRNKYLFLWKFLFRGKIFLKSGREKGTLVRQTGYGLWQLLFGTGPPWTVFRLSTKKFFINSLPGDDSNFEAIDSHPTN